MNSTKVTSKGAFRVWEGKEYSALHHTYRNSYEVTGPDGRYFQQYEKDNMRRILSRVYGFGSIPAVKREVI